MILNTRSLKGLPFIVLIAFLSSCGVSEDSATRLVGNGSATLRWIPPTQNTDNTALTDLTGYNIYYGTEQDQLIYSIKVASLGITEYVVENLVTGTTYYFNVTVYNSLNSESLLADTVSKQI